MGILIKPTQGLVSGKVGDIVYRIVDGQVIIVRYTKHIKASNSEAAVKNRIGFGEVNHIVKGVNTVPVLKKLWKDVKGKNIASKFAHANRFLIGEDNDISSIIIAPYPEYFPVVLTDMKFHENRILITIDGLTKLPNVNNNIYVSLQGVLQFIKPTGNNCNSYKGLVSKDENYFEAGPVTFTVIYDGETSAFMSSNEGKNFLLNVVYKNTNLETTAVSQNIFVEA